MFPVCLRSLPANPDFKTVGFLRKAFLILNFRMEYNTSRLPVAMLEWGRGIQSMAAYLLTIEDKTIARRQADVVIEAMTALNISVKQEEDYRHKLWDQLHLLTGNKLEIETPYPKPEPEKWATVPEPPAYPNNKLRRRQWGHRFEALLQLALLEKDEQKLAAAVKTLGYYMKLAATTWHREQLSDESVRMELERVSDGKLKYEGGGIAIPFVPLSPRGSQGGNRLTAKGVQTPDPRRNSTYGGKSAGGPGGGPRGRKFYKQRGR